MITKSISYFFIFIYKEMVIDMDIKELLKSPKGTYNANYIKGNFPDHYIKILKTPGGKFSEKLYQYIYPSAEHRCVICGNLTKFKNIEEGYYKYCSCKCSAQSDERKEKIKHTTLQRYGVENASQSSVIKQKKKDTCLEHYGVESPMQSPEIQQKFKNSCLEKYGVENVSQSSVIKQKKKDTCLEHYGVESHMRSPEYRYNIVKSLINKYGSNYHDYTVGRLRQVTVEQIRKRHPGFLGYTEDGMWRIKCSHPECNKCTEKTFIIPQQTYNDRLRWKSEICTRLQPIGEYSKNTSIEIFIKNILDEYNIDYITNTRDIIPPLELDIYIPSKKIAIECNGVYWHSSELKTPDYHLNKYVRCKEKGIQLLSLWEDWVLNKPQILASTVRSKVRCINGKVYARKCVIREINSEICGVFLNSNHLQGSCKSSLRYGLYQNDELVAVMCFSRRSKLSGPKTTKDNEWELIRFCSKLNTTVVGGASKLLQHFIREHRPQSIISFSCNDISNGNLYKTLGFIERGINKSYWYIHKNTFKRYHRSSFTKSNIKKRYPDMKDGLTESQMMDKLPYIKIYDSGTTKWEYIL